MDIVTFYNNFYDKGVVKRRFADYDIDEHAFSIIHPTPAYLVDTFTRDISIVRTDHHERRNKPLK